jgi:phospho-2-dehydro-3-deoxyheptonate aldolase
MQHKTSDQRISDRQEVLTANTLIEEQPISEAAAELVFNSRQNISKILSQEDKSSS